MSSLPVAELLSTREHDMDEPTDDPDFDADAEDEEYDDFDPWEYEQNCERRGDYARLEAMHGA